MVAATSSRKIVDGLTLGGEDDGGGGGEDGDGSGGGDGDGHLNQQQQLSLSQEPVHTVPKDSVVVVQQR